jgi:DNA processing protein
VPTNDPERLARMTLSRVCEPGDVVACKLVREHSAVTLLERLRAGGGTSQKARDWAERLPRVDVDAALRTAEKVGARYVMPGDPDWPPQLDDLHLLEDETGERRAGAPFGLWVRGPGDLAALCPKAVAIVGARACTTYGERVCADFAYTLGEAGYTVISGGAYGIDAAAHRGALTAGAATVAVLAGGIDRLYPASNASLLMRILETAAVVSEAAPGCASNKSRFLVRNRLIAALSSGTVVVEAALRSGSLNTARWARDLGRQVMGVPGPVTSDLSGGVHELLRQPETVLVADPAEVIEQLSPVGTGLTARKVGEVHAFDGLDSRSKQLLDAVPKRSGVTAQSIAAAAGLQHADVTTRLGQLRALGLVTLESGRWRLA